jgi:Skp family chaperone for outer membrane proteins
MQRSLWAILICGSLVGAIGWGVGCDKGGSSSGGSSGTPAAGAGAPTAVVDLDKVARDLGWLTKLQANMEAYQTQLKNDLQQFQQRYEAQVQQHVKDMIPPGTKEGDKYTLSQTQSQELTNYIVAARQQVQQLGQEANQLYSNYRLQWARQYRDALSPIVRAVAQDKRMNVVLVQNENVMYADRSMDLTDSVVDAARKQPPTLTEVPMTRLQGPPDIRPNQTPNVATQPSTQPGATTQP